MLNNTKIKPEIGLSDKNLQGVAEILTTVLADEFLFYTKLRNFHWNVTGPQFRSLHELFEEQYNVTAETIDDIAERIRSYGVNAIGTLKEFADHTRLNENPGDYPDARSMVMTLVSDHEAIIRYLRDDITACGEKYDDVGAEDFLTGLLEDHQEMAWMLRTFVEGQPTHN